MQIEKIFLQYQLIHRRAASNKGAALLFISTRYEQFLCLHLKNGDPTLLNIPNLQSKNMMIGDNKYVL